MEFPSTAESSESKDPGAPDERLQAGRKFNTFVLLKSWTTRNVSWEG